MNPNAQIIYDMICQAAELGLRCPTNEQLSRAVGATALSVGARIFRELVETGHLSSDVATHKRVVTVVATGKRTATPPPPKVRALNGLVVGANKRRENAFNPRELTSEQRMAMVKGGPPIVQNRIEVDVVGAPSTCQYPFGDGPYRFCGKTSVTGRPYCPRHLAVAYTNRPPKSASVPVTIGKSKPWAA